MAVAPSATGVANPLSGGGAGAPSGLAARLQHLASSRGGEAPPALPGKASFVPMAAGAVAPAGREGAGVARAEGAGWSKRALVAAAAIQGGVSLGAPPQAGVRQGAGQGAEGPPQGER